MRLSLFIILVVSLSLSQFSYAEPIKVPIKDGFLVDCISIEDRGIRILKMELTNQSTSHFKLALKTFICDENNGKMELKSLPLSTPVPARHTLQPLTFKIIKTSVLIMNTENTVILMKINFDANESSPAFLIEKDSIKETTVDMTIVGTGITKLDDVIVDESPSRGGHFRFTNLD